MSFCCRSGCAPPLERFPKFPGKSFAGEWFGQEATALVEDSVCAYHLSGVAGHVDHSELGPMAEQFLRQNSAVDPGHHNIGQQSVNRSRMLTG